MFLYIITNLFIITHLILVPQDTVSVSYFQWSIIAHSCYLLGIILFYLTVKLSYTTYVMLFKLLRTSVLTLEWVPEPV